MSNHIELREEEREKIKEAILAYVDNNPSIQEDGLYNRRDTIINMLRKQFQYFLRAIIFLVLFISLAYSVNASLPSVARLDDGMRSFLGSTTQSATSVNFFSAITFLGDKYFVISLGALIFLAIIYLKRVNLAFFFYGGVIFALGLAYFFKNLLSRARPESVYGIAETGYSFPSAHALISVVFYGLIAFALYHILKKNWQKILVSCLLGVVVFFIGLSRVMIDVHWPSDVIGGWFAGCAVLFATIGFYYLFSNSLWNKKQY